VEEEPRGETSALLSRDGGLVEDVWGDGVLDERGEYRYEDGEDDDRYEDDFGAGTPRTPRTPPERRDEAPETSADPATT
jgi:hypothetical protein